MLGGGANARPEVNQPNAWADPAMAERTIPINTPTISFTKFDPAQPP
jgi:hypothetical protein